MQIKYLRVYHQIKEKLLDQTFRIGDSIGTEEELAQLYGVSRVTIRKALDLLKEEGIIESKRGRGNRVLSVHHEQETMGNIVMPGPVMEFIIPKPWKVMNSLAAVDIVDASAELAEWFGTNQGDRMYRVQHLRYVNEVPCGYISTFYPLSVTPELENKQVNVPVTPYVKKEYGLQIDRREDLFMAEAAGFKEMQYLSVALKDPLLCNIRFLYCGEKLMEVSVNKINARIARFRCSNVAVNVTEEDLLVMNNEGLIMDIL